MPIFWRNYESLGIRSNVDTCATNLEKDELQRINLGNSTIL